MKLFQQMLVAGASLSLLAPVAAQANDIDLDEMTPYNLVVNADNLSAKEVFSIVNSAIGEV